MRVPKVGKDERKMRQVVQDKTRLWMTEANLEVIDYKRQMLLARIGVDPQPAIRRLRDAVCAWPSLIETRRLATLDQIFLLDYLEGDE